MEKKTFDDIMNEASDMYKVHGSRPNCGAYLAKWYEEKQPDMSELLYMLGFVIEILGNELKQ